MSKKLLKGFMILLISVFFTPSLLFCAEEGTIKLGLIQPLSGPYAKLSTERVQKPEEIPDEE